jgi:hypothetical protein
MSSALVIAIWINSISSYTAALPVDGVYREKEFLNSGKGVDDFVAWLGSSGSDKIDLYCVGISGAGNTVAAKFWLEGPADRIFFVNPLQMLEYAKKHQIEKISAKTLAMACAGMFPKK